MKSFVRALARALPPRLVNSLYGVAKGRFIRGPLTYVQDGLATIHNSDFRSDPKFAAAYEAGRRTGSWGDSDIHWRAYVACWAAERGASLEGDFVECGVNRGGLAMTVYEFVGFDRLDRTFFLLDTFEGLVERCITERERDLGVTAGGYEHCWDAVQETFRGKRVRLVRGVVPDTLPEVTAEKIAYLSIDMNCVAPEIAAAEAFWPRLSSGAVMLLDDYGWPGHIEQKRAFDAFASARGVRVLPLPTGQGIVIKP